MPVRLVFRRPLAENSSQPHARSNKNVIALRSLLSLVIIGCLSSGFVGFAQAQAPPQGRPILFAHGWCSDGASDWLNSGVGQGVIDYLSQQGGNLYTNPHLYYLYYDGISVKHWPTGNGLSDIPLSARFFAIEFSDPDSLQSPSNFSKLHVVKKSILNKADELAQVIQAITTISRVQDVVVIGHSMGGLDARAYLEGLASPFSLTSCTDRDEYNSCAPGETKYTSDINSLVTIDTPHGGAYSANVALALSFLNNDDICWQTDSLNRRELEVGSSVIQWLQEKAQSLPPNLTAVSIESYTVPGFFFPYDDMVVSSGEQSLGTSIRGFGQPPSLLIDALNGGPPDSPYSIYTEALCHWPLHVLSCLGAQPWTYQVLNTQLNTLLSGQPGQTTSITVHATLDGQEWPGPLSFQLNGPDGQRSGQEVPAPFYTIPVGQYSLVYTGGGPRSNPKIDPPVLTLGVDHTTGANTWTGTFSLVFCSNQCPAPTDTTLTPTGVVSDGAVLNGSVNPNGAATSAWFEWSTDPNLRNPQFTPAQVKGSGNSSVPVRFNLTGLETATQYYYAVAANNSNDNSSVLGAIQPFRTLGPLPAPTLISPPDRSGNVSIPPTFSWTAVDGATSYRIIVATNSTALPTDPSVPTCGPGCVINSTPVTNVYTPPAGLAPSTQYFWEVHARSLQQFGTWSSISSFTTAGPNVVAMSITPPTIASGDTGTVMVALNGPAPSGGVQVPLSSTNQQAFPVTNVSIPAGSTTGSVSIQAGTVSTSTTATVTASYNNSYANATVTVNPLGGAGIVLGSVSVSPSTVVGGLSPLGSVFLSGPAPSGGAMVQLSSNNPHFVQVPFWVTVQAGYTSGTFPVTTVFTSSPVGATILASYNQTQYGASVTVLPLGISGLTFYPSTVSAGSPASFTVYLNGPAPAGATISLTSSNSSALQVAATVPVPIGAFQVVVTGTTFQVPSQTTATVNATYNGSSGQGAVTIVPIALNGLSITPLTITGGNNGSGTVYISSPAPPGGIAVTLSSSNSSVLQVPAAVTVPAGSTSATFVVSTAQVGSINNVTVTAGCNNVYDSVLISVVPPLPYISSLTLSPSTVNSGSSSIGTVTLTAPAPLDDAVVSLTSTVPYTIANVPRTVVVPAGSTSASFNIATSPIGFIQAATVTASYNNTQQSATLIIVPPGTPLAPASLTLSPPTLVGGNNSSGFVLLTEPVPPGGSILTLSSDNPNVSVPPILNVPEGVTTAQFTVNTLAVNALTTATISTALNGIEQSSLLTVKPSGLPPPNSPVPFLATPLVPLTRAPGGNGLALMLQGSGFVSGATAFWNGTQLDTTVLSNTQLQAFIPASDLQTNQTALISVANPGPVSALSNALPEHLSFSVSTPTFNLSSITASGDPAVALVADLNRDGKLDLVIGNYGSGLSIFLGNGDGTFGSELLLATQLGSSSVAIGDINGDGKPDIIVGSNYNNGTIGVFLGNGDGTFTPAPDILLPVGSNAYEGMALADVNNDGNLDILVTAGSTNSGVYVLLGNGDGTFQSPINVGSVVQPNSLAVADFNGDGKLDLAMPDGPNQAVAVLFGNGDGTFQPQVEFPANGYPSALVAADFNGDGLPDIAVANEGPVGGNAGGISILLNMGNGHFAAPVNYAAGQAFYSIASDDVNGDGKLDLLVSNPVNDVDLLFLGNGDGSFSPNPIIFQQQGTFTPTIADLNKDGAPDVISPSYSNNNIAIFLQAVQPILMVAPQSLSFTAVVGEGTPPPLAVQVINTGGGTLNWAATSSQPWLILSARSGTAPSQISVTVNPSGLNPGVYNASITIAASGASNSPQTISVTLTVTGELPVVSSLTLSPPLLVGPGDSSGTVTLDVAAPNGGATVNLSSDLQAVQVPPTVTIPAGANNGSFTATASGVTNWTVATITATYDQVFTTSTLTVEPGGGLQFIAVPPCRLVDTRQAGNPILGGTSQDFTIPHLGGCNIPTTAAAYSLNVTVLPHGPLKSLTVWPTPERQPTLATMSSTDGRVRTNATIVPAGASGAVSVYVSNTSDVILDINGYFLPAVQNSYQFYPLTPCRVINTLSGQGLFRGPFLRGGVERDFPMLTSDCIPPGRNPQAYSLNITVQPHQAGETLTYVTAWAKGHARPDLPTLSDPTGTRVSNAAIVAAGSGGGIAVYPTADADMVVDINGYFAQPSQGGLTFYPSVPCRALDTGTNRLFDGEGALRLAGGICEPGGNAEAYLLNTTVVPLVGLQDLTVWPNDQPRPNVTTLSVPEGGMTSNIAIVPTTNGAIDGAVSDRTELIVDLYGYFAP